MALLAQFYRFLLGLNVVGDQQRILYMCMALDAPHIEEVPGLVWQPVMFGDDVGFYRIAYQLKFIDVVVAAQTNIIVIRNDILYNRIVSCTDLIGVGLVAGPAVKVFGVFCGVCTQGKFLFDFFKLKFGILLIAPMTIDTGHFGFHPNLGSMRPYTKIL
jgi:hypothetical protein